MEKNDIVNGEEKNNLDSKNKKQEELNFMEKKNDNSEDIKQYLTEIKIQEDERGEWVETKKIVYEAKYPFVKDNIFLIARVDSEMGKQELVMQKINPETEEVEIEDKIVCIHTSIMDMPVEDFASLHNDVGVQEELYNKTLNIRWSGEPKTIELTPEEHFKAFKSWVAGISEAGIKSFKIQDEIDKNLNLMYPIVNFIMKFLVKCDPKFIPEYLAKIERECRFEGKYHIPSLIANLKSLVEIIFSADSQNSFLFSFNEEERKSFAEKIFSMELPLIVYEECFFTLDRFEEAYNRKMRLRGQFHSDLILDYFERIMENCRFEDGYNISLINKKLELIIITFVSGDQNIIKTVKKYDNNEIEGLKCIRILKNRLNGADIPEQVQNYILPLLDYINVDGNLRKVYKDNEGRLALNLNYLSISDVSKIKKINEIPNLQVLDLSNNEISNISDLGELNGLNGLEYLNLVENKITKIEGLDNLKKLEYLGLKSNKISKIEGLDNLKKLEYLKLSYNKISKIEELDKLTQLKNLDLGNNKITKIEGLDKLTELKNLDLTYNKITKIEGLENLIELKYLRLYRNGISKIEGFGNLTKLKHLNLSYNEISMIEGLENLTKLKDLSLGDNNIERIKGLENLIDLEYLWLYENRISKIEGLGYLTKLEELNLGNNKITKIEGLDDKFYAPDVVKYCQNQKKKKNTFH